MPNNNVEIKAIFEKDAAHTTEHTVTVTSGGNGTASPLLKAVAGAEITLSATPDKSYHLKEWQVNLRQDLQSPTSSPCRTAM